MKKITIVVAVLVAILLMLVCVLIMLEIRNSHEQPDNTINTNSSNNTFGSDNTETSALPRPWDAPAAKQPADYTWEEFLALSPELQIVFQNAMGVDAFEEWMNRAQSTEPEHLEYPWEQAGAKQPEDYTWDEFLGLSPELQMPFQYAFGSAEAFDAWLKRVQPTEPETEQNGDLWEQPGGKRPEDFTWEEFLALSPESQIAFQNAFGSAEALEEWLNRVQTTEPEQLERPWEQPGGKRLEDYTWEEFLDLSGALQIIFQQDFGADAFEEWMNRVKPRS